MATNKQLVQTVKDGGYKGSSQSSNTYFNPTTSHRIKIEDRKLSDNGGNVRYQATIETAKKFSKQS